MRTLSKFIYCYKEKGKNRLLCYFCIRNYSKNFSFNDWLPKNGKSLSINSFRLPALSDTKFLANAKKKSLFFMESYENFIGIKQVRDAQERVLNEEMNFMSAQDIRRKSSKELSDIQNKLRDLRSELERTRRGEDKYLEIITKETNVIKEEKVVKERFVEDERSEREAFDKLSRAFRSSHEKENAQREKTKYWSIFGSLLGATLGIFGTIIHSKMKIHKLQDMILEKNQISSESYSKIQNELNLLNNIFKSLSVKLNNNEESPNKSSTATATLSDVNDNFLERLNSLKSNMVCNCDQIYSKLEDQRQNQKYIFISYTLLSVVTCAFIYFNR